jgi:uncharacterized protein (TIGR00661 family)
LFQRKNILVCPLDWGIGHATRCIPIIQHLTEMDQNVIVAADRAPLALLEKAFPKHEFIQFPGFAPVYSRGNSQIFSMAKQSPLILHQIEKDHQNLEQFVKLHKLDAVISDNRFGAYSKQVHSVFMTHQLHIRLPSPVAWLTHGIEKFNKHILNNYNECWIPDFEDEINLSGELSHPPFHGIQTHYIGALSRLSNIQNSDKHSEFKPELLILLSGPEPHRSLLENICLTQLTAIKIDTIILRGLPEEKNIPKVPEHVKLFNHVSTAQIFKLIQAAKTIVARSGYSTIMDLVAMGKTAVLIPTPGQTEQEYLASLLESKGLFKKMNQQDANLNDVLKHTSEKVDFLPYKKTLLEKHLRHWLQKL